MRAVLQAISEELARLKAEGHDSVPVSEEALAGLRALVAAHSPAPAAPRPAATEAPPKSGVRPTPVPTVSTVTAAPAAPKATSLPAPPVVQLPSGDRESRWAALRSMVETHPVCLAQLRPGKQALLGAGALDARIFFISEAPEAEEEDGGQSLAGPAGELLAKMIGGMGLKREEVFVANAVCWRPHWPLAGGGEQGSRSPTTEEMSFCLPFLRAAIEVVQPDLLVVLGGTAAQGLLGDKFTTLAAVRSKWHEFAGRPLMVTYHPSYLLRSNSKRSKRAVWEDLLQVMERAGLPITEKQRGYFL